MSKHQNVETRGVLQAIYAVRKAGYRVHNGNLELPTSEQDLEIAKIIEEWSGLGDVQKCLFDLSERHTSLEVRLAFVTSTLKRLNEKVKRANLLRYSGGNISKEDWVELGDISKEADALLKETQS